MSEAVSGHPSRGNLCAFTPRHLQELQQILPVGSVLADADTLTLYSHDWTEDLRFMPHVVVKPTTTAQVAAVLAYCHDQRLPVTPCGARTGLSGGMLPVHGGVMLSLEKMNQIVELDTRNLQIRVQPGVVTQLIDDAAREHGLMYPPDPSSKGSCTIGGNLAENAGGAHAVKYGITQAYVLALEAVLPTGEVIHTGARVLKNSTGYNLTQLLVGSEGTLAVITEATLKLVPRPAQQRTLLVSFGVAEDACQCVSALFRAGLTPAVCEFIEIDALKFGQAFLGIDTYPTQGVAAHLLLEFDGPDEAAVWQQSQAALPVLEAHQAQEVLYAETAAQQNELWRLRRCLGEAVKGGGNIYKEEDTVVPRAELARLLAHVKEVGHRVGFRSVCYGHAGDGNLHVNILKDDMPNEKWQRELPGAIRDIFQFTVSLGGTLSGEHGIGWVQRPYMDIAFTETELALMRGIKQVFDPHGILNPGKIF